MQCIRLQVKQWVSQGGAADEKGRRGSVEAWARKREAAGQAGGSMGWEGGSSGRGTGQTGKSFGKEGLEGREGREERRRGAMERHS